MIEIVEQAPRRDDTTNENAFPTYMRKNGKDYFMFNRLSTADPTEDDNMKMQLFENEGAYFCFYGACPDPIEMLTDMANAHCGFKKDGATIRFRMIENTELWDFSGSKGLFVGTAFLYRVYDADLAEKIKAVTEHINRKEWHKALAVINKEGNSSDVKRRSRETTRGSRTERSDV